MVVKILGVTGGLADLDIDGSGTPAGSMALAALGVTDAERTQLAVLYSPGQSLWRVPIPHFSWWDFNWPWGLPWGATPPINQNPPSQNPPRPDPPSDDQNNPNDPEKETDKPRATKLAARTFGQ